MTATRHVFFQAHLISALKVSNRLPSSHMCIELKFENDQCSMDVRILQRAGVKFDASNMMRYRSATNILWVDILPSNTLQSALLPNNTPIESDSRERKKKNTIATQYTIRHARIKYIIGGIWHVGRVKPYNSRENIWES